MIIEKIIQRQLTITGKGFLSGKKLIPKKLGTASINPTRNLERTFLITTARFVIAVAKKRTNF